MFYPTQTILLMWNCYNKKCSLVFGERGENDDGGTTWNPSRGASLKLFLSTRRLGLGLDCYVVKLVVCLCVKYAAI